MSFSTDQPVLNATAKQKLALGIQRHASTAGDYPTLISGLSLHRRHAPTEVLHCIYGLGVIVVVQGQKQLMLGNQLLQYGAGQSMLITMDTPVSSHVTLASDADPFLALMLTLDLQQILQIASNMKLSKQSEIPLQPLSIQALDLALADAMTRLIGLLDEPDLLVELAPLIQHEIIVRLLSGSHGAQLQQLVMSAPPSQQIIRAVTWLKQNFMHVMHMDELAARAHMSPSTFRQHFRAMTGMSPLQFQKQLRLQEARQLMLNHHVDASQAAEQVGYESASQFSREYSRLFGAPPLRDIRRMHGQ